jgi:hypothetical protein
MNERNVVFVNYKRDNNFAKGLIEIIATRQGCDSNGTSATCLLEIARREARFLVTVLIPKVETNWACPKIKEL